LIVGHGSRRVEANEDVQLAARLIGARTPLEFKKGAICRIDFDVPPPKGTGQLRWFVTPRMLREIA